MENFELTITIGERIRQSEKLPIRGTVEEMLIVKSIKNALVGFAEAQKDAYRIVENGASIISGKPGTSTIVRLTEEQVVAWAKFIRTRSSENKIDMEEADVLQAVLNAADSYQNQ